MAESILQGFVQSLLDRFLSMVANEVSLACGVKDELLKLQRTLVSIRAVIADAEQRQSRENGLRIWIENLRDVLYDSENVVDEFECEALRKQVIEQRKVLGHVHRFFSNSNPVVFRLKMGHKIKKIGMRLNEICAEKDAFNLNQQTISGSTYRSTWRETHSRVVVSEVIGRDNDKDVIIKRLLCPNPEVNPFIVSVIGIGGMGKTALAKLVYNDDAINRHFDSKIWVCVSEEFDLKIVLEKIIKAVIPDSTYIQSTRLLEVEKLQQKLHQLLKDKKFLLVLDDVWSEDQSQWQELRNLLKGGEPGSIIMVMTRSSDVASAAGSFYVHKLKGLSQPDCLKVFNNSLDDGNGSAMDPELLEIACQIVEKCGGVPLVVKAVGGLLRSNRDVSHWRSIRNKDVLDVLSKKGDVLPIVKLSYDHLPPHLKRCFVFCSLLPKDYDFNNMMLGHLWIAAGYISTSDNDQKLEETSDQYLKELFARSFFQEWEDLGAVLYFKMHDIVHDLAISIAKEEQFLLRLDSTSINPRVRHVSLFDNSGKTITLLLKQAKNLQTLRCGGDGLGIAVESVLKASISNCKYLRILDLKKSTLEEMPSNIDRLKHLRYLNLSYNVKLKRLPNTMCNLPGLIYFAVRGCLSLEELPRDMRKLINLRYLIVTTKQKSLKSSGIECLKSLESLELYECHNLETLFEGMNTDSLTSLRVLALHNCGNLKSIPVSSLKPLSSLEVLSVRCCGKLDLSMEGDENFSSCLRTLYFEILPSMVCLPKWVQGAASTLQALTIVSCEQLEELPEWIEKLLHLERLHIVGCERLSTLPEGVKNLAILKSLKISDCDELGKTCGPDGADWHKISHIPNIKINGKTIITG